MEDQTLCSGIPNKHSVIKIAVLDRVGGRNRKREVILRITVHIRSFSARRRTATTRIITVP